MKIYSNRKIRLLTALFLFMSFSLGQKIVHMDGSFDLDGDNLLEFISLELDPSKNVFPTMVRYNEIDTDGYQTVVWEFDAPKELDGYFVDAKIGDLDGNGVPDLIIVMNLSRFGTNATPHVFVAVYNWENESFSELPSVTLDIGKQDRSLRCNNFAMLDQDADGDQELVLSLGSPYRGFAFLDLDNQGRLVITKKIRPDDLLVGSGLLYAAVIDYDNDGYEDVLAISPEGSTIKAQPFYNIGGIFDSGQLIRKNFDGINGILHNSFQLTDWDADGFKDVLASFRSGDIIALTLTPATLVIERVPVQPGPLTQIEVADFNQDTFKDLLMLSSDINALTMVSGKDGGMESIRNVMSKVPESIQVFSMLPLTKLGNYTGNIIVSGWDGKENSIYILDLGEKSAQYDQGFLLSTKFISEQLPDLLSNIEDVQPEVPEIYVEVIPEQLPQSPQPEEEVITELGEQRIASAPKALDPVVIEGDVLKEQPKSTPPKKVIRTLETPKILKEEEMIGQRLPKHVLPQYVLTLNQPFEYMLLRDTTEAFHSFRWQIPPPKGMFFHYESQTIRWVPNQEQLDAFPISYIVRVKIDEIMEALSGKDNQTQEYKTVPVLESRDEKTWIYVNDPPRFLTQPLGTEFVAGGVFQYEPIVRDRNKDASLQFYLEVAPPGMSIKDGVLYWKSDSINAEQYDVRLVVSDGFERDVQEFQLSARSGIRILSKAPNIATVGEKYNYDIKVWRQRTSQEANYKLFFGPSGMTVDKKIGVLSWVPQETQIDTVEYALVSTHGVASDTQFVKVFVNHPPVIQKAPAPMTKINVGGIWDFDLKAQDPNVGDKLIYIAHVLPEGMRMDPHTGRLHWEPSTPQVDFHKLRIEISDGNLSKFIDSEFFVNAPIKIVSVPTMTATVGDEYSYKIMTVDRNEGALLPFNKVVKVEDVSNTKIYSINISDDVVIQNIDRFLGDWHNAKEVYYVNPKYPADTLVSRINLKRYVQSVFYEDNRLWVITSTINGRTIKIKDFLWEFFQGNKGKPPRLMVERVNPIRFSLTEFPEGMEVDESLGAIKWTPKKVQTDMHRISLMVSDGYTKDEQVYEVYSNHMPTIISNTPRMALVGELFKYQIRVEDLNEGANLKYTLIKGPHGMQLDKSGKVLWVPKAAQINYNNFEVSVTDGYGIDIQSGKIFINNPPSIISTPKPVGLTGHTWRYKLTTEDLNGDRVTYRAVRLPKFAKFDRRTATIEWTPRKNQDGVNDFILMAVDEHGATTTHDFQVHVFYDPSAKQLVNSGWPLMLTFVGVVFAWGAGQMN